MILGRTAKWITLQDRSKREAWPTSIGRVMWLWRQALEEFCHQPRSHQNLGKWEMGCALESPRDCASALPRETDRGVKKLVGVF